MYNRYLAAAEQTAPETNEPPQSSTFSGLGRTLNARLQGVRLDMDTMIALLIVWFLHFKIQTFFLTICFEFFDPRLFCHALRLFLFHAKSLSGFDPCSASF